jgi:hypothetical protein
MTFMRKDIFSFINGYLAAQGLTISEDQLEYKMLGDVFEKREAVDEFVTRTLRHYHLISLTWSDIETFNDLVHLIETHQNG